MDEVLVRQLRRQSMWYQESYRWLLAKRVLPGLPPRPQALDVGCGPGFVMERLADLMEVRGVDLDQDMVSASRARGLEVSRARAERLPFADGSFDVVYCAFLLVWTPDPEAALREMARVSRRWVLCLAEPDYAARVDHPPELEELTSLIVEGAREAGGDPRMGRRLRALFSRCGLEAELGVHGGIWDLERTGQEGQAEWEWARSMAGAKADPARLDRLWEVWRRALREGSLLQFNPAFYALGRK